LNWKLINGSKKFKTILDFYNNKITCQGFYYKDLRGYQRDMLANMKIESFCLNPCTRKAREEAVKFLKQ